MDHITEERVGRYTVRTHYDNDGGAPDPRKDYTQACTFALTHGRYDLPNEADVRFDDHESWDEVEAWIRENHDVLAILPIRGYDHGQLRLSTSDRGAFSDRWDSGQAGFVFVTKHGQEETGVPLTHLDEAIAAEVAEYDAWANGEVYGFTVTGPDGSEEDSCWGFIGEEEYALSEARSAAEYATFRDACTWAALPEWVRQTVLLRAWVTL